MLKKITLNVEKFISFLGEMANKRILTISKIFGFYFAFLGIWDQDKLIGVAAFIFLLILFSIDFCLEKDDGNE